MKDDNGLDAARGCVYGTLLGIVGWAMIIGAVLGAARWFGWW